MLTVEEDRMLYRHQQDYRVRFGDLDTYRHVNNKAFLSYVEDARVRYLVEVGGFSDHYGGRDGVMVVHVSIDYVSQIEPFERVRVLTRCARLGNKSFTLHHLVLAGAPAPDRVAAGAVTVFASVDMQSNRSCPNNPEMVARIRSYEPSPP